MVRKNVQATRRDSLPVKHCIHSNCCRLLYSISRNISCPAPAECRQEGVCFRANCSYDLAAPLSSCNDGNPLTDFDVCDADGVCQGEDLCSTRNVTCPPATQVRNLAACACCSERKSELQNALFTHCLQPHQCREAALCQNGLCLTPENRADNLPCDDGNEDSHE